MTQHFAILAFQRLIIFQYVALHYYNVKVSHSLQEERSQKISFFLINPSKEIRGQQTAACFTWKIPALGFWGSNLKQSTLSKI